MAFVSHGLQTELPLAAFLDLRKAYDSLPRDILIRLLWKRLPPILVKTILPLLDALRVQVEGQNDNLSLKMTTGVPQGDPESPDLFNIFMDEFIEAVAIDPNVRVSCFADDAAILGNSANAQPMALVRAETWASNNGMQWNARKSSTIGLEGLKLGHDTIERVDNTVYLGVSMSRHGITQHKLLERIQAASNQLGTLFRLLHRYNINLKHRRNIVKTIIFGTMDYLLYLQPLTGPVLQAALGLERRSATFILRTAVPKQQHDRALALCGILPLKTRRRLHLIDATFKMSHLSRQQQHVYAIRNWETFQKAATIASFLRLHTIHLFPNIHTWREHHRNRETNNAWPQKNNYVRQLPNTLPPPAICNNDLSKDARLKSIKWYFNKLKFNATTTTSDKAALKSLLEKINQRDDDINNLEAVIRLITPTTT